MRLRRLGIPLLLAVFSLFAGLLATAPPAAAKAVPPPVTHLKPVPVHPVHGTGLHLPKIKLSHAPKVSWPSPGSATVTAGPSAVRAGSLPVWVAVAGTPAKQTAGTARQAASASPSAKASPSPSSAASASPSSSASAAPSPRASAPAASSASAKDSPVSSSGGKLRVSMASRQAAAAVGIPGIVFTVSGAAGSAAPTVRVKVDYSSFAGAYGGNYGSRLRLAELPACALTTPQVPACRKATPLATDNNEKASTLSASVPLPAGTPAAALATAPSPSSDQGNYAATKLTEAGSWAEGGNSGAFTYSYPVSVPAVPGGLKPSVSLDYNSQTVDGLTSATDNQASLIGDGWNYDPGSIQTSYPSCEQQPPGSTGWKKSADLCDSPDTATTLTLNGKTTRIVKNTDSSGTVTYRAQADGNEKIQVAYGATNGNGNGSRSGQYWIVTEPDGTKYVFGQNQVKGYASGDAGTGSAWDVPVYDYVAGGACPGSYCWYPYRWNLDYVVSPHGDAEALFYNKETNYYATNGATTANADYTQGGALSKIIYGFRDSDGAYAGKQAGEVDFTTTEDRTDIPTSSPNDLACASGAACQVTSPTFWSKYRLTTITTKAATGTSGSLSAVDSWALAQCHESTADSNTNTTNQCQGATTSPIWLSSIQQTGQDGGSAKLPPVTFIGTSMPNLVVPSGTTSTYSLIPRDRLTRVVNETGGETDVSYTGADNSCHNGTFPAADANTTMCYPDWWTDNVTNPASPTLKESWFNKYSVSSVTAKDTTGGSPAQVTNYTYAGPAWHYTEDPTIPSTPTDQRTWDEWRGYHTVTTETGASPDPVTKKADTYLQGMDGDHLSNGSTSSVSVSDSKGDSVTDSNQYEGTLLEDVVYNGTSGSMVTDTVTLPRSAASGATQSQPAPMPALQSFFTGTKEQKVYTALAGGGNRESDTTNTFDSYGRITQASDVPDTSDSSQDACTTTTYADNTAAWIMNLAKEVKTVSVPCGTTPSYPADAISDKLAFYDGATSLSSDTPSKGDVTETQLATSYDSSGSPQYTTQSTSAYDEYGRVLTSADADNRTTTTSYSPATGQEPSQVTVTDPQGLQTVTTYDQARDLPLTKTSPAGLTTTETYDALGRLTAVWTPGNATSGPASVKFAYTVSQSAPSFTVTSTLDPNAAGYLDSATVYDSLGQTVEAQSQQPGGGWDISDTTYDSSGRQTFTAGPYYAGTVAEGALVEASKGNVADETNVVYDGAGRPVQSAAEDKGTTTWETDTAYGGNYTTTSYKCAPGVPKCQGTPETVFTDGRGLKTAIYQYHAGVSPDPAGSSSGYDKTTYTYFPSQKLQEITDAAGNKWDYTYDLSGNELTAADPDSGTTTDTYDAANQLVTSTDARGRQVSYVYDADGRKTAEYDTTGGASETSSDEIASWTFDTLAKGRLTSSASYYNGDAYTEKTLGYNAFGEPTGTAVVIPASQGKLAGTYITLDKAYTATGELQSYQDSAAGGLPAETVNYAYDAAGNPVSVQGIWSYVASLSYDELGRPAQYTMGSGSAPAYVTDSYDPQTGRLAGQQTSTGTTPATVDDLRYAYDNVGNVLSESDQPSGGAAQSQCFSYDYLGRLTTAWSQGSACSASSSPSTTAEGGAAAPYWNTYTYDATGNLTKQTSEQPDGTVTTTTGTFPAAGSPQPHAAASEAQSGPLGTATTAYQYDASGHLASSSGDTLTGILQSQSLAWDDAGRLSSVTGLLGSLAPTASYFYGADGNLLIEQDSGQSTLFLPDEQIVLNTLTGLLSGTRYYTIGGSGTSTSSGTTGNANASSDASTSGSTGGGTTATSAAGSSGGASASGAAGSGIGSKEAGPGGGATVACRSSSGSVNYLVGDQQGTAGLAIDSGSLAVTQRYYDPYGNPVGTPPGSWPGGNKGFVGGTASAATGLTNLGAREYQPQTETFISPDSILNAYDPQNLNAYAYASDNPATNSDPSGQMACADQNTVDCLPPGSKTSGPVDNNPCGLGKDNTSCFAPIPGVTANSPASNGSGGSTGGQVPCNSVASRLVAGGCTPPAPPKGNITWAGWTHFINYASLVTSTCALFTAPIPVAGEVCGTAALLADSASAITNGINGVQAASSGDASAAAWDFGSAAFSFAGIAGVARGMRAASTVNDVKEGASNLAEEKMLSALNSAKSSASLGGRLEALKAARIGASEFERAGAAFDERFVSAQRNAESVENQSWLFSTTGIAYSMQECSLGEC